jgi:hypothetical protein
VRFAVSSGSYAMALSRVRERSRLRSALISKHKGI